MRRELQRLGWTPGKAPSESELAEEALASSGANVSPGPPAPTCAQHVANLRALSPFCHYPSLLILLDTREIQQ